MHTSTPPGAPLVHALVPMAHVVDMKRSTEFYAHLGFTPRHTMGMHAGAPTWAWLQSGDAAIMLVLASAPIDAAQQAVLFYMYSTGVSDLRDHLLRAGLADGGPYIGQCGPGDGCRVVFNVTRPHYMPDGEIRVHDPDGYCILIGQRAA